MATSTALDSTSEGEAQLGCEGSLSLKLFSYSRELEFRRNSSPAACQVLGDIDLSSQIAGHIGELSEAMLRSHSHPYHAVSIFGRLCTATYPSGMSVLYRNTHIPILWAFLIDEKGSIGNKRFASLTNMDAKIFGRLLHQFYGKLTRDLVGEDLASYRLRRFFFICSRVRTLWTTDQWFTPKLSAFFMKHMPFSFDYLFPSLNTIHWIENGGEQQNIALRTTLIEMPAFQAFRPAALRFLNFELHDTSTPLRSVPRDKDFLFRIVEFMTHLRQNFPDFYMSNICVCRPDFCAHPYIRAALDQIHSAVMRSEATVISKDIPLPCVPEEQMSMFRIRENLTFDSITAKGRTWIINPEASSYLYPVEDCHLLSAHVMMSPFNFTFSYHTNMSLAVVTQTTLIIDIIRPFLQDHSIQHFTFTLESVAVPFLPCHLLQIGADLRHLHCLHLHFQVNRVNAADIPVIETIRLLTSYCPVLKKLYLPELNVLGIQSPPIVSGISSYVLDSLSSSVLLSCDEEASDVASVLLSMFPNLKSVMISGLSSVGWGSIQNEIHRQSHNAVHAGG